MSLNVIDNMKATFLAIVLFLSYSFAVSVFAEDNEFPDPHFPLPERVGDWNTINERFMKWEIAEFEVGGEVADGGSLILNFKTADAAEFHIIVACSAWWTKEDRKEKQQPIFVSFENKDYRVSKGSEYEKRLLAMLNQAAWNLKGVGRKRPIYIQRLHDLVKSRTLRDDSWPFGDLDLAGAAGSWNTRVYKHYENNRNFDNLDLDEATGDWSKIQEQFKKWEIVKFDKWDTLGDCSTLFEFKTSDESEIGILVSTIRIHYPQSDDPFGKRLEPEVFPQVVFLCFKRQLYRVEKGSETETILLAKLERAAKKIKDEGFLHSKYIDCLSEVVKSRNIPDYKFCPFDHIELEDQKDVPPKP